MGTSLSLKRKWGFAMGNFGFSLVSYAIINSLPYFYQPPEGGGEAIFPSFVPLLVFGLPLIGVIGLVGRLVDGFTDPWIARLSDRSTSAFGRRRIFMAWSLVPTVGLSIAAFIPLASTSPLANGLYLVLMVVAFYVALTGYIIPYTALISELGKDQEERLFLATITSVTWALGFALGSQLYAVQSVFEASMDSTAAFQWSIAIFSLIAGITMVLPITSIDESKHCRPVPANTGSKALRRVLADKNFMTFAFADFLYWMALTFIQTGITYYVITLLGLEKETASFLSLIMFALSFLFYFPVLIASKRWSKRRILIVAFMVFALSFAAAIFLGLVPLNPMVQGVIVVVLASGPLAAFGILPNAIIADCAAAREAESGEALSGQYFGVRSFLMKAGSGVAMLIFTLLLSLGQSSENPVGIRLTAVAGTAILVIAMVIMVRFREIQSESAVHGPVEGAEPGKKRFPSDFLFGCATAALQVEGGDRNNNWFLWSEQGKIKDGSHSLRANDHYRLYREDNELLGSLGVHTHRMGIEWSRIEPQEGQFSQEAIDHYRDEIKDLLDKGIRPLVTLHHFTEPLWFYERGSWLHDQAIESFIAFVRHSIEHLGDLVSDWITINEPNVYLLNGLILKEWPPAQGDIPSYLKASSTMIAAHKLAYTEIHAIRRAKEWHSDDLPTRVGVAHHLRIYDPAHPWSLWEWAVCSVYDRLTQGIFAQGMTRGRYLFPLKKHPKDRLGKGLYSDFFGINYYTRDMIAASSKASLLFGRQTVKKGSHTNNLGWETYPEGLGRLLKKMYSRYDLPLWITENGTCDGDDSFRWWFTAAHLNQVLAALERGLPLERYYHWTLMDNFEWTEGESAPFGLYHVDFDTQERTLRPSGQKYGRLCKTRILEEGD